MKKKKILKCQKKKRKTIEKYKEKVKGGKKRQPFRKFTIGYRESIYISMIGFCFHKH